MYYKARKVDYRPYLIFDLVAYSSDELKEIGLIKNGILSPGVVMEKDLPGKRDGVCLLDLDDSGDLIPRSENDFEKGKIEKQKEDSKKEIQNLKSYLKETDWIVVKCMEVEISVREKYPEIHMQRQFARNRINELEKTLTL